MKNAEGPMPRLRFPEFRDAGPWEVKRLGELVTTIAPPKKLQTTEYQASGRFPVIDQSPSDICGWTDDELALVEADFPVVIFGDHSCVVKLADEPFAQGADGIKICHRSRQSTGGFSSCRCKQTQSSKRAIIVIIPTSRKSSFLSRQELRANNKRSPTASGRSTI